MIVELTMIFLDVVSCQSGAAIKACKKKKKLEKRSKYKALIINFYVAIIA